MLLRIGCCAAVLVTCLASGLALAQDDLVKLGGVRIYSNVEYSPSEGDFNGDQIMIIPSNDGEKVLWRVANGEFSVPLLLDAIEQGRQLIKVKVPNIVVFAGEWTFEIKGTLLYATGPKGVKFTLKQISLR
jgi:hypothetical protein